jgi:uncharacterized protein HemX
MKMILLEWFTALFTAGDDLLKVVVGLITALFSGSKIWDAWQKRNDNETKVKEAQINANKEIQNNKDKHKSELDRLQATITHNESEIRYKDSIILNYGNKIDEKSRKIDELVRINERKDEEIIKLHERLLKCSEDK